MRSWYRYGDGLDATGDIKGVKALSRDVAWAVSLHGGTILRTTNAGQTWDIIPHPTVPRDSQPPAALTASAQCGPGTLVVKLRPVARTTSVGPR